MADNSNPNETRHLNDELVAACHAQAMDRPLATAAAVSSIKLAPKCANSADGDVYSGSVQLVFQGIRVFVFKVFAEEFPANIECIRSVGNLQKFQPT